MCVYIVAGLHCICQQSNTAQWGKGEGGGVTLALQISIHMYEALAQHSTYPSTPSSTNTHTASVDVRSCNIISLISMFGQCYMCRVIIILDSKRFVRVTSQV